MYMCNAKKNAHCLLDHKASTLLLVGLLKKSELPKMHDETTTMQVAMNSLFFSSKSNPLPGYPPGPLTKPQCIVWFSA